MMPPPLSRKATILSPRRSGFTLFELIISTGVIVVMLAVSLPAFLSFQRRQELLTAAHQIRDGLLEAHNYALAPRGSETSSSEDKPAGADLYRVIFIKANSNASYYIEEQTNQDITSPMWWLVKQVVLPRSVSYCAYHNDLMSTSLSPSPADRNKGVMYSIKELGRIISPADLSQPIVLHQKSGREQATITVNRATGRIDIVFLPTSQYNCS